MKLFLGLEGDIVHFLGLKNLGYKFKKVKNNDNHLKKEKEELTKLNAELGDLNKYIKWSNYNAVNLYNLVKFYRENKIKPDEERLKAVVEYVATCTEFDEEYSKKLVMYVHNKYIEELWKKLNSVPLDELVAIKSNQGSYYNERIRQYKNQKNIEMEQ
ncbi:MAG: hypothetical protein IJZ29_05050 [Clostridia bacterium]|nr:hypothetical protein [Clostridia bacterium]